MNRVALLLGLVVASAAAAAGKIVSNPDADFVQTADSVLVEFGMQRSDEILRLDMDLFGDGKKAMFFTYRGNGSKIGPIWTGYVPTEGEGYHRIDGFQFRADTYRAGVVEGIADKGGLVVFYPGKGAGDLIRYDISNGIAKSEKVRTLDYENAEDKKLFETIFQRPLDKPLSAEYFAKPPYRVLSAASIRARTSQDLRSPTSITPSRPSSTPVPSATPPLSSAPSPSGTSNAVSPPVTPSHFAASDRHVPMWAWLVGIAALAVIAALILKRRA